MADKMITIQLVNGENYIGRGYHFKKGDTAEMTKAKARPFLMIEAGGGKKKFSVYDPDLGLGIPEEPEIPEVVEEEEDEPAKIAINPKLLTEPKDLRQWLTDNGIEVAANASMAKMKSLIPNESDIILEDDIQDDDGDVDIE